MKIAAICYHKNLNQYPEEWIDKFRDSILNQTFKDFDILEMDYNGKYERIFDGEFYTMSLDTFADAMNDLMITALVSDYDYVFNTNVDDWYSLDRIEKQLELLIDGYDIVSSNFTLIKKDKEVLTHKFASLSIKGELSRNHNIICHPVVAYSKKFIEENMYYSEEIPFEDMKLWQRTIDRFKFIILEDNLCYHRIDKHI